METALTLVTLLAIAVAVSAAAGRVGLPAPLMLIVVGIVGSYLPFVPDYELTPELVLIGLLPPLLYAAAIRTSLVGAWQIGASFIVSALGGALVGLVVAIVIGKIRKLIEDEVTDVAVSLLTPWIAYLPAEEIHLPDLDGHPSGVLAVVVAGIILGHKSPIIQSASSRLFERTTWQPSRTSSRTPCSFSSACRCVRSSMRSATAASRALASRSRALRSWSR